MTKSKTSAKYSVSNRPVVTAREAKSGNRARKNQEEPGELPRSYGQPIIFAIARDPRTLFVYWDLDWPTIFSIAEPHDRKVLLRVCESSGTQESEIGVEPLAGSCCVPVSQPRATYRVEIGYFHPESIWNSVGTSIDVTTPPDAIADDSEVDVVTVPFHLSFQRMIDAFRGSKTDGEALTELVSRLQKRTTEGFVSEPLSAAESELLGAIGSNVSEMSSWANAGTAALEKRLENILGFGSTSPANGFSGSSRSAS
jgi:hypothetical protein